MNKDRCKDKQFIFDNAHPRAYVRTWQACAVGWPPSLSKTIPTPLHNTHAKPKRHSQVSSNDSPATAAWFATRSSGLISTDCCYLSLLRSDLATDIPPPPAASYKTHAAAVAPASRASWADSALPHPIPHERTALDDCDQASSGARVAVVGPRASVGEL
jgi:hypothetical protein